MLTLGACHTYHIDCTLRNLKHLARLKTSSEVRAPFAQILEMTLVTGVRGALLSSNGNIVCCLNICLIVTQLVLVTL